MKFQNFDDIFIFTTDTVTGIACKINDQSLEKIYFLKNRPFEKKIMILVGSLEQARSFKQWNEKADQFANKHWPGAFSVIVNDQGFRMPNCPQLCEFLLQNGPMYATSANKSGQQPIDINQAHDVFPEVSNSNVFNFGPGTNQASQIFNCDTNEWIIRK
ncbi:L-threonylcarbamoyladenylate synthase [Mycoplasmopsis pullorum]|uniref:L-threonylcarbamoyladenylate synthase n=1 Tax=Mycoplasmopsis pullorum TaxID=48003 RepID=A0A1L4FSL4_9BACT|nr:Sua5/YciO/YrdC/YwlC family protein [Mycoplasmopsis pullorum]APJ38584.1 SUA5-like translation suppressor [Mycoplasmopsis pullorum]